MEGRESTDTRRSVRDALFVSLLEISLMYYQQSTILRTRDIVIYLIANPAGLTVRDLTEALVAERKTMERTLAQLAELGVVSWRLETPRLMQGGRARKIYFVPEARGLGEYKVKSDAGESANALELRVDPGEGYWESDDDDRDDDGNGTGGEGTSGDGAIYGKKREVSGKNPATVSAKNREALDANKEINNNTQENTNQIKNARENAARVGKKYQAPKYEREIAEVMRDVTFDEKALELRRRLSAIVWEPSLKSDLLDRAVAAFTLGFKSASELVCLARRAVDRAGKKGASIWSVFCLDVKSAFERMGIGWNPTGERFEAAPSRVPIVALQLNDDEEPRVRRDANGRVMVCLG